LHRIDTLFLSLLFIPFFSVLVYGGQVNYCVHIEALAETPDLTACAIVHSGVLDSNLVEVHAKKANSGSEKEFIGIEIDLLHVSEAIE